MSLVNGTSLPGAAAKQNARPKMTVRSTLISASGMAKPTGTAHNVSDLACRSRHHSDLLAGPLTPFRRPSPKRPARRPLFSLVEWQYSTQKSGLQGASRPCVTIFPRCFAARILCRQDAARCAASCSILFSVGKICVGLPAVRGLPGDAQHFQGLHLYSPYLSACFPRLSTSLATSVGISFSSFSALRQRDSNAEMWARC